MTLIQGINHHIRDKNIKRLVLSAYSLARGRGETFLGVSHVFLYLVNAGMLSCVGDVQRIVKSFPLASECLTPAMQEAMLASGNLSEFVSLIWRSDLFRLFSSTEPQDIDLDCLNVITRRDSLEFLKTLGRIVPGNHVMQPNPILITAMSQILSRQVDTCVLLIGTSGVGKTTVVAGLQKSLEMRDVPLPLQDHVVIEVRPRDDQLVSKLEAFAGENIVAFIDEAHGLVQTGNDSNERLQLLQPLKPMISSGELKLILATTTDEAGELLKDAAFKRRAMTIRMEEPRKDEVIGIVRHRFPEIPDDLRERAYVLCERYIRDEAFPGKIVTVLESIRRSTPSMEMLLGAVCMKSGKPYELVSGALAVRARALPVFLRNRIIGQDAAVQSICRAFTRHYLDMSVNNRKPLSFLFAGPSGTGKTSAAKGLACFVIGDDRRLHRFSMNEYSQKGDAWKLLGSSAGFIGSSQEPRLSRIIREDPAPVLLFDEIEKADHDVIVSLLTLLDEGIIADNQGRALHFEDALIILTTNAGSRELEKRNIGFNSSGNSTNRVLLEHFTSEFLNRLNVIAFSRLTQADIMQIIRMKTRIILDNLGTAVEINDDFYDRVLQRTGSLHDGVREVERLIEDELLNILMEKDYVLLGESLNRP